MGEACDANFRPLQIRQYRDETAMPSGQFSYQSGSGDVFLRTAMGEIQSYNIHPGKNQPFNSFGALCGWT
ncbi:hypothetical protein D3C76_699870 [compost metagenome]